MLSSWYLYVILVIPRLPIKGIKVYLLTIVKPSLRGDYLEIKRTEINWWIISI